MTLAVNYLLGPILFLLLSFVLYRQLLQQPDLALRWSHLKSALTDPRLMLVVLLMTVNWGLESAKWQQLALPIQPLTFMAAYQSVLAGCSITLLTPNRTGEFGGRILWIRPEERSRAVSAAILGSVAQLSVTLLAGTVALFGVDWQRLTGGYPLTVWSFSRVAVMILSGVAALLLVLLFFRIRHLPDFLIRKGFPARWQRYLTVLEGYSGKDLLRISGYSVLRYLVFILQYMLILDVMEVRIAPFTVAPLLAVFFLMLALVPTLAFTELPLRSLASLLVLQAYSDNTLGIQVSALGIWLINILLPALIGALLMLRVRIFKTTT